MSANRRGALWLGLTLAVIAAAHATGLLNGFVYDDAFNVTGNSVVTSFDLRAIFSTTFWAATGEKTGYYRPLLVTTFALDHAMAGLRPWAFHLSNVVLHLGAAALVFTLARIVTGAPSAAAVAALVFGLHPVQVEVVGAVSNRGDLLVAVFSLAMLLAHRSGMRATTRPRQAALLIGAAAAYAGACLSKESGALTLLLALAFDLLVMEKGALSRAWLFTRGRLLAYAAYVAVLLAYLSIRAAVAGPVLRQQLSFINNPLAYEPFLERKALAVAGVGRYVALLAYPGRLSADYSYHALPLAIAESLPYLLLGIASIVAFTAALLWWWRKEPRAAFGLAWAGTTFVLTSNLIIVVDVMFAERFLYLPLVGLGIVAGSLADRVTAARRPVRALVAACAAAVATAWAIRTAVRHRDWRDDAALYEAASRAVPGSAKIQFGLGQVRSDAGDLQGAARAYARAVEIMPRYAAALSDGALVYSALGQHEKAVSSARSATELSPSDSGSWNNRVSCCTTAEISRRRSLPSRPEPGSGARKPRATWTR